MDTQSAQPSQVTTTIATFYHWVDTPTTVALIFALAGAVFVGIYVIRRLRGSRGAEKKV
jgi:flagellar biogenesis protein FliO